MAGKIFISYRREDAKADARQLRDRLTRAFGRGSVFMDVDNLLAGQMFDRELKTALAQCDVFLAVIGPRWMEILDARGKSGERDYVREEIAAAIARGILSVPVLIDRTPLPREDALPEDMRALVRHQKHEVVHEHFWRDADALVDAIKAGRRAARSGTGGGSFKRWGPIGAGAAALAAGLGIYRFGLPPWSAPETAAVEAPALAKAASRNDAEAQAEAKRKANEAAKGDAAKREQLAMLAEQEKARAEADRKAKEGASGGQTHGSDPNQAFAPGKTFRDCWGPGGDDPCGPEMVVVPAGSFTMGSNDGARDEKPPHLVTIANPFAAGKFEVTFAEWDACVAAGGCHLNKYPSDGNWGRGKHPAINVSWDDAKDYAAWLSKKTAQTYRLLTEAEWEYLAHGASGKRPSRRFYSEQDICAYANHADLSVSLAAKNTQCSDDIGEKTAAVGSFKPNPFGLFDLHGNVFEWVEDSYCNTYDGASTSGIARKKSECIGESQMDRRVVRGGAWNKLPVDLRPESRAYNFANDRANNVGFRLGRTL